MRLSRLLRFRLSRSPLAFWLVTVLLALMTGLVVARFVGQAQSLAARYGPLRPVVVASREVERGTEVEPADLAVRQVPAAFLPETATRSVAEVAGRTTVVPLLAGQPVFRGHLAPEGLAGVAALLPPGTRAVAVPVGGASVVVRRGDVVDVLASFDPQLSGTGEPTLAVALDALVVDAGTESATLAVSPEEARAVAFAVTHGTVTVTLTPGLGGPPSGPRAPLSESRSPGGTAPPPQPAPGTPRRE
ncbi:MAG: Flp pilus assembly protein CpaB [Acidimicrobiales bacterium]